MDFAKLKSEIQLLERNDFLLMRTENERLMADIEKLKQRLREEITRTTAGVRLDLNLEKGRIRDESSVHALKIKEVDTRIESEIAGLRTSIQTAKFNVLQVCALLTSTLLVSLLVPVPSCWPTCVCLSSLCILSAELCLLRAARSTTRRDSMSASSMRSRCACLSAGSATRMMPVNLSLKR